jgi:transcriptional regulator with XRE-family HTH domain
MRAESIGLSLLLQGRALVSCSDTYDVVRLWAELSESDTIPEQASTGARERPGHRGAAADSPAGDRFAAMRLALAKRRKALGMSMSGLARKAGVSPSMVSQIERGQTLPSVATLFALATALGADIDVFFGDHERSADRPPARGIHASVDGAAGRPARESFYVVRGHERATVHISGGVRWERLTPAPPGMVDFLELVYAPGAESSAALYRHPGIEMTLVLDGTFRIDVGFEQYVLERGDSIQFASSLPHRYANPTNGVSRAVTAIVPDTAAGLADPGTS